MLSFPLYCETLFLHLSPSTSPSSFGQSHKMVASVLWSMLNDVPASDDINIIFFGLLTPGTMSHRSKCRCLCIFFSPCFCYFFFKNVFFLLTICAWSGLPLSFLWAEKRIRRVLDRKEQVKRKGSLFAFASSVWAFFKRTAVPASPFSSGS